MPPKKDGLRLDDGILYFNGNPISVISNESCEIEVENAEPVEILNGPVEATFDLKINCKALKLLQLTLIHGRSITNNWLKMHGYPMVRGRFL